MPIPVILAFVLTAISAAAPEPDIVPRRWQLELKVGRLRYAAIESSGGVKEGFFYLTYRVMNLSGNDLLLAPAFEMASDVGPIVRSGRDVPAEVTRSILEQIDNPLVQDQISILGTIPHGEENARDGVVIWRAPQNQTSEIVIYAQGFSGETRTITTKDGDTGEPKKVTLRKTLMVRYPMAGEIGQGLARPFEAGEQRWILR